ncbi:MAG: hypothetical protein LBU34_01285 [Planctomycetaceae bacterium]|jgi:hypothetical protein|nr:hypothetical protein [Planctomycetaceae bacterium]
MLKYYYCNRHFRQHSRQHVSKCVNQRIPFRNRTLKRGLSTIVALVVLAVVSSTVLLLSQTIIQEQRHKARQRQIIQADILVDDLHRIAEKQKQNVSVTIPASELYGVADLRLTATVEGENITATGKYVAEELPADQHYSTQKQTTQK